MRCALELTLSAVFFFAAVHFPSQAGTVFLEDSWGQALGFLLLKGARAGIDYVFTYGPLGYFGTYVYVPELWWWHYGVNLVLAAAATGLALATSRRIGSRFWRLVYWLVLLAHVGDPDRNWALVVLQAAFLLHRTRPRWPTLMALMGVLSFLSLIKFTFFVESTLAVAAYALHELGAGRRRRAGAVVGGFSIGIGLFWVASGQPLVGLPIYLYRSFEIARGYGAMAFGNNPALPWSLGLLGGVLGLMLWAAAAGRIPKTLAAAAASLLVLVWRESFIRADGHVFRFFGFALAAGLLALAWEAGRPKTRVVPIGLGLLLALGIASGQLTLSGEWIGQKLWVTFSPRLARKELEGQRRQNERRWALPRIRAAVGKATVDALTIAQGAVFLNGLNWKPRPVFQSYAAYTPYLQELNRAFFAGAKAPRFLLVNWSTIDHRLPSQEDGAALPVIWQRYRRRFVEGPFLLLERRRDPLVVSDVRVERGKVGWGKSVALDRTAEWTAVSFHFPKTTFGWWKRLLYRESRVFIHVRTGKGTEQAYRLVPATADRPFLLSPLVEGSQGFDPASARRIARFYLTAEHPGEFEPAVDVEITTYRLGERRYGPFAKQ